MTLLGAFGGLDTDSVWGSVGGGRRQTGAPQGALTPGVSGSQILPQVDLFYTGTEGFKGVADAVIPVHFPFSGGVLCWQSLTWCSQIHGTTQPLGSL